MDVERRQLENRQEFAEAGIRLEIEKLRIQADKEVQQEFARALATFLSKGNMTLYGTPETAQKMMDNMAKGFGIRAMAEGFLGGARRARNGHCAEGASQVDALLSHASAPNSHEFGYVAILHVVFSAVRRRLCRQRQRNKHSRPLPRRAINLNSAAQQLDSLANALQAKTIFRNL